MVDIIFITDRFFLDTAMSMMKEWIATKTSFHFKFSNLKIVMARYGKVYRVYRLNKVLIGS